MSGEWGRARVRAAWEGPSWPVCGSLSPSRHHTFQTPYPSWARGPPRVQNLLLVIFQIPKEFLFSANLFVVIRERFGYPQTPLFGKKIPSLVHCNQTPIQTLFFSLSYFIFSSFIKVWLTNKNCTCLRGTMWCKFTLCNDDQANQYAQHLSDHLCVGVCVCGCVYLNTEDVLSEQNSYFTRLKYNQ